MKKGCYLLTVSLPTPPEISPSPTPQEPTLHLCLKIALDLHMRFLFGLKSWTNYALQFHRLDRELDPHSDTFLVLFSKSFCRVIAMLSTSYECRGCPGVVVDCKTLLIFLLTWGKQTIICRFLKKCKRYSPIHSHIELNPGHSAFLVVVFFPPRCPCSFYTLCFFHCKPWWRSKVTKVSWRRQPCTAAWIQTSLHFVSFWAQFRVVVYFILFFFPSLISLFSLI